MGQKLKAIYVYLPCALVKPRWKREERNQEAYIYNELLLIRTVAQEMPLTIPEHTNRFWQTTAVCSDVRSELRSGLINNSPGLITALHGVPDPRVPRTALNRTQPHCLPDKFCNAIRIRYYRGTKVTGYKLEVCPTKRFTSFFPCTQGNIWTQEAWLNMVNITFVVYKHLPIMVRTVKIEGKNRTGKPRNANGVSS